MVLQIQHLGGVLSRYSLSVTAEIRRRPALSTKGAASKGRALRQGPFISGAGAIHDASTAFSCKGRVISDVLGTNRVSTATPKNSLN